MSKLAAAALVLASFALACFVPVSCGTTGGPVGQFGPYADVNSTLRLPTGDTMTVYRLKYWVFSNGDAPALQLEYAAHVPVSDTDAVIGWDRAIWPSFAPYVEHLQLQHAMMTATVLTRVGLYTRWRNYTVVIQRDTDHVWRLRGHPEPLPAADTSDVPRIILPTGKPIFFMTTPPTVMTK